ncbi:hypothetical protein PP651_gp10 [Aeromonas phage ZPAH14]|uniref:Uncharacterized protein n=1 Tax=Aeromonas phage ZPAH14 TaxID=2924887 RepID=A0AAE9GZQ0_9CAUD|nr:hypothetical protein PP651_gp10 [Aeromonas phage ZPAH14]UOT58002.1 hypothetical protein [Aeromonas phage ZPAH14]
MSTNKFLPIIRRIIIKHKVRKFAIDEIQSVVNTTSVFAAKAIYWAVVNGCNSATVEKLCISKSVDYAANWARGRDIEIEVRGL